MTTEVTTDEQPVTPLPDVWEEITRPEPSRRPRIAAGFLEAPPAELDERPKGARRPCREFRHPGADRPDRSAAGSHLMVPQTDWAWDRLAMTFRAPDVRLTRRGALVSDASATCFRAGAIVALLAFASRSEREGRWALSVPTGAEVAEGALVSWFDDNGGEWISLARQVPPSIAFVQGARNSIEPTEGWNTLADWCAARAIALEFDGTVRSHTPGRPPVRMTPAAVAAVLAMCARSAASEPAR